LFQQRKNAVCDLLLAMRDRLKTIAEGNIVDPMPSLVDNYTEAEGMLAWRFGGGSTLLDFLYVLATVATEPRASSVVAGMGGPLSSLGLSIAAVAPHVDADTLHQLTALLSPHHLLRSSGLLISAFDGPQVPASVATPWTLHPRLLRHLCGDDSFDDVLVSVARVAETKQTWLLSDAQTTAVQQISDLLTALSGRHTVIIEGPAKSGRGGAALAALASRRFAAERSVIDIACDQISEAMSAEVIASLQREILLRESSVVFSNIDVLWDRLGRRNEDSQLQWRSLLGRIPGNLIATASQVRFSLGSEARPQQRVRWPVADTATRRRIWQSVAGARISDAALVDELASNYQLGAGAIIDAARAAATHQSNDAAFARIDLLQGIQNNIAERLGELAIRVEVNQRWNDLVLPPDTQSDVEALIDRVTHSHTVLDRWGMRDKIAKGTGVAALFSGQPGTGKTMVAGLIASRLNLELYQVDLSRIVSKWVGETEKQLSNLFDAAESGHALLLFDEADSLFAKRSNDVKSATDRYANLEVNYLLQRVESFNGVVILTTNLDSSIDPALRRRLASHIVFQSPDRPEQAQLWKRMLQSKAPVDASINVETLVDEFPEFTGANIRNVVMRAAFAAAAGASSIGQNLLRAAARSEYRAMGRVLASSR
jgi:hypothetical protein